MQILESKEAELISDTSFSYLANNIFKRQKDDVFQNNSGENKYKDLIIKQE